MLISALMRFSANTLASTSPRWSLHDERIQLVEHHLEPELARLMDDDEEQLVRMLGTRPWPLEREQLVQREIRRVRDLAAFPGRTMIDSKRRHLERR